MNGKLMCCGGNHCDVSQARIEKAIKGMIMLQKEDIRKDERKKVLKEVYTHWMSKSNTCFKEWLQKEGKDK